MSRIVKSSFVKVGDKKEIGIEKVSLEDSLEINEKKHIQEEVSYEDIYKEKMLEIEEVMNKKIEEAETQVQRIISDAYEDAKQIYENAKKDGFLLGKSEGYEAGKKEADVLIKEALDIKKELLKTKENMVKELEKESIELVINVVEKILNTKTEDSYETIIGLVKSGLSKCAYTESLVIRVSPDDYEYAINVKDKILCLVENVDEINIKQDPSLKKGSCVIDTASGSIDSSIETQFNQIKSLFYEILESE
ncbi:hypothetical protein FQB35_07745 [Crassaminicella thermophila]|uniref:Flagellar assembly protein FliH/Type III secretion system HrpE domain-containing protein n=1 Tax=Crassaminicella thermophila TaxID=2599308 RepID=A0A5C0SGC4_CRATE|nr:FliH/SctL family protein [Crassaminicella thermophila]QEK12278.1 hypothetical protein FQB35_07745 [Crassaminicella thermophila]